MGVAARNTCHVEKHNNYETVNTDAETIQSRTLHVKIHLNTLRSSVIDNSQIACKWVLPLSKTKSQQTQLLQGRGGLSSLKTKIKGNKRNKL